MRMSAVAAAVAVALLWSAVSAAAAPTATTTATPGSASATPVKQPSLKACNKRADAKNLTGAQRSAFVKSCRGGQHAAPH